MPLANAAPIGFIPTTHPETARLFYEKTLSLRFVSDDGFALVFLCGAADIMLRVVRAPAFQPLSFTLFGWEIEDIKATVHELTDRGVVFQRFEGLEQDSAGIWSSPGGARIAWFHDPDGNLLSVSQHSA